MLVCLVVRRGTRLPSFKTNEEQTIPIGHLLLDGKMLLLFVPDRRIAVDCQLEFAVDDVTEDAIGIAEVLFLGEQDTAGALFCPQFFFLSPLNLPYGLSKSYVFSGKANV